MSRKGYFERLKDGEVLPAFREDLKVNASLKPEEKQRRIDARTDILATILAAYPSTPTKRLAKEFNVSVEYINAIARNHGVTKSGLFRGHTAANKVEKVDADGNIVAVYESVNKAAQAEGVQYSTIRRRVEGRDKTPLNGFTYRLSRDVAKKPKPVLDIDDLDDFNIDEDDFLY
jgi:hypothetical protein